jgi:tRNA uridine 5-carboxymethylaminomethyl modification enzyme
MFTSRAEYRISLRADNADLRLTRKGKEFGLIQDPERIAALEAREYLIEDRIQKLQSFEMKVTEWALHGGKDLMGGTQMSKKTGNKKTAEEILQMPHVTLKNVEDIMLAVDQAKRNAPDSNGEEEEEYDFSESPQSVFDSVEAMVKYRSYVQRQSRDIESWRKAQGKLIPGEIYPLTHEKFPTMSKEEIEKLSSVRPKTFAEASQISGVTPQSLVFLYHVVTRKNQKRNSDRLIVKDK